MKVHPVIVSLESARKLFKNMAEGRQRVVLNYSKLGKVLIGRGNSTNNSCDQFPEVNLVTPAAMAADQARAQIKRKQNGRRKTVTHRKKKQTGGRQKKQPIRRRQKKKKVQQKKTTKRKVTKRTNHSKRSQRRDNFS